MSGPEFFQTRMGQTFFEHTMPKIAEALAKIASSMPNKKPAFLDEDVGQVTFKGKPVELAVMPYQATLATVYAIVQKEELAGHFPRELLLLVEKLLEIGE